MKKLLSVMLLLVAGLGAYAQKSYVNIVATNANAKYTGIFLSGAIPSDMKDYYDRYDGGRIGDIMNMLSQRGFVLEQMSCSSTGGSAQEVIVMSRQGVNPPDAIQRATTADSDREVTEVARYNLQGMPIGENEKGIQIVVYSNYTTKTVIVE